MRTSVLICFLGCLVLASCSEWVLEPKLRVAGGSPDMVLVGGGTFQMGSNDGQIDEKPAHTVTVKSFLIGRNEVTVRQYQAFCTATNRQFPFPPSEGWQEDSPIVNVNWDDATAYCAWLSQHTGKRFRLPTEAEWEYAARGGNSTQNFNYAGSNTPEEVAWFGANTGLITAGTRRVGQKKPNELQLYDMSGNVWEWCSDWYGGYPVTTVTNPTGPGSGSKRVARGGSWFDFAVLIRVKARYPFDQAQLLHSLGFRVVQDT